MSSILRRFALPVAVALALLAAWKVGHEAPPPLASSGAVARSEFYCPMHPTYVSDKPGDCSICGMKLVPRPSQSRRRASRPPSEEGATTAAGSAADEVFSQATAADEIGDADQPVGGPTRAMPSTRTVIAGRTTVVLTPESRRILGVHSDKVRQVSLVRRIRAVARVAVDERRVEHLRVPTEGTIERVYVPRAGQRVVRGERLVRVRLEDSAVDLTATNPGQVLRINAVPGARVGPADSICDIADLSHVVVLAEVYETELPSIQVGMEAAITVLYLPGKAWQGKLVEIAPTVDSGTRTITLRIEVEDTGGLLKPDMYADVLLRRTLGMGIMVPENAVIFAGNRRLVFVEHEDGSLEPRELRLGQTVGMDMGIGYQVLSGLAEGERVVTSGNFLIDSESSLKGAIAALAPTHGPLADPQQERPAGVVR
jgi:hypothetical protein